MAGPDGPRPLADGPATLGESPLWDPRTGRLHWVDIPTGLLHTFDGDRTSTRALQAPLSAVGLARQGLVVAVGTELRRLTRSGVGPVLWSIPADRAEVKSNDARMDSRGRWWIGSVTADPDRADGRLYRVEEDTGHGVRVTVADHGLRLSNGIAFAPDEATMYVADSLAGVVYAYDFDVVAGTVRNRRTFVRPEAGSPDGLAVDARGGVWVALWDGWQVRRYLPTGDLDRELRLPVAQVTSCVFGGPDLDTLYLTTARENLGPSELERQPLAGRVFALVAGETGLAPHYFGSGN